METRIFLKYLVRGCSNSYLDYLVELIDNYDKTYLIGQKLINGKYPDLFAENLFASVNMSSTFYEQNFIVRYFLTLLLPDVIIN